MSSALISVISIIVGLYSLSAAVFWLIRPAAFDLAVLGGWLIPSLHVSITLFAAALMLYAIHARRAHPRLGAALNIIVLPVILAMGLMTASGYHVVAEAGSRLVTLRPVMNSTIPLGLVIALIGFLSLFRRIGPWALMAGGAILLVAYLFLFPQAKTIAPILGALIGIGFILAGSRQYQERSLQY